MVTYGNLGVSYGMVAIVCLAFLLVGAVAAIMHVRHRYEPSLIAALIGAFCCFLLLEAIPAIT
jgi:hypothetical protein